MREKIGQCLVQAGLITESDLQAALAEHARTGERVGLVLVRMSLATEKQIAKALAAQLGFPYISLVENPPDPAAVVLIPKEVALKRACVAVRLEKNLLTVAMADPLLFSLVQDLEFKTGHRIKLVVSTRADILDAINSSYPEKTLARPAAPRSSAAVLAADPRVADEGGAPALDGALTARGEDDAVDHVARERTDAAPIAELILQGAIRSRASDIHVEPTEAGVVVRHRLDGQLKDVMDLPAPVHEDLAARLKSLAGMDVAQTRLPQVGRLRVRVDDGADIDFRVSTVRTLFGEKIVMRWLDRRGRIPALEEIGLSPTALAAVREFLRQQRGLILVAGPAGSGKTTTLGSAAMELHSERANIVTVEDPIEYRIPGASQMQVDDKLALTFAAALRSILEQDPDVILLGDMRDRETAGIAVQTALAGRLILSAICADDGASAVSRVMDLGVEPAAISSALVGVVAQRLVRRLCEHCRRQYTPQTDMLRSLNIADADETMTLFYKPVGCVECSHTGYRGRIGIFEVMPVTDRLRRLIASRAPEDQIRDAALAGGTIGLAEDGLAKLRAGLTSPEELLRVAAPGRDARPLCARCGSAVGADFVACPQCGHRLTAGCPHCGRSLQPGWAFCPYCARATEPRRTQKRPRERDAREARRDLPAANVAEFKK